MENEEFYLEAKKIRIVFDNGSIFDGLAYHVDDLENIIVINGLLDKDRTVLHDEDQEIYEVKKDYHFSCPHSKVVCFQKYTKRIKVTKETYNELVIKPLEKLKKCKQSVE